MGNLSPLTSGFQGLANWAAQFTKIEENATEGATAGTNLKDSGSTVLDDADVITIQGTADDTANINGNTTSDVINSNGQLASATVVPGVRSIGPGSSRAANPLSATDAGSDATIDVAAHTQFIGDATGVSYNAGSITGLAFSTQFYVFTDDPTFAGGAVTYQATTDVTDLGKDNGRYYVAVVTTPADGGGDTGGSGGGGGGSGGILP